MFTPQSFLRSFYYMTIWTFIGFAGFIFLSQGDISRVQRDIDLGNATLEDLLTALDDFDDTIIELDVEPENRTTDIEHALEVESHMQSLPLEYWYRYKNITQQNSAKCAKYPPIADLQFSNTYWQVLKTSNAIFYFLNAYYDNRTLSPTGPTVRILAMIDQVEPTVNVTCQMWFEGVKKPVFAKVFEYRYIWNKSWGNANKGRNQPHLLSCQVPATLPAAPYSVSIVANACDTATNNLRILNNRPANGRKQPFAVCVKGLDFLYQDLSALLIEWIESIHALGADKIFFYNLSVHDNITKVLSHYQREGIIDVQPLTLPGTEPNIAGLQHAFLKSKIGQKRLDELIPYNDCLYRNMYRYDYIALLDIDEIIVPTGNNATNWRQMMTAAILPKVEKEKKRFDSFNFRNVFVWDIAQEHDIWHHEVPPYFRFLSHVHRSLNYSKPGAAVKCFHDTESVMTLHNHFPRSCLSGSCRSYSVPVLDGHMQHYCFNKGDRGYCHNHLNNTVIDRSLWKVKDEVMPRAKRVLEALGFLKS